MCPRSGQRFLGQETQCYHERKNFRSYKPPLKNWVVLQFRAYWPVAAPYAGEGKKGLRSFPDSWSFTRDTKGLKGRGRGKNPLDLSTINLPKKKMREKYSTCKSLVKKKEENHRTCQRPRKTALGTVFHRRQKEILNSPKKVQARKQKETWEEGWLCLVTDTPVDHEEMIRGADELERLREEIRKVRNKLVMMD